MTATRSNKNNIILMFGILLLVVVLIVVATLNKQLSWAETYEPEDKNPYGTQVLYELLKVSRSDQSFFKVEDTVFKDLPVDPTDKEDTYLFIGADLYADSTDIDRIMKFVAAGNSAFIITHNPHHLVTDSLLRGRYAASVEDSESLITEDEYSDDDEIYIEEDENEIYYQDYIEQENAMKKIANSFSDTSVYIELKDFNRNQS